MTIIKEREWRTKFNELPLLLKIVVTWVYFISILKFMKFLFEIVLADFRLNVFALAYGYLIWELAGGLVNRSNLARIVALICFGFTTAITAYVFWHDGTVLLDSLTLKFLFSNSIIWIVTSLGSVLILLLPQVRRVFSNSTQEGKR